MDEGELQEFGTEVVREMQLLTQDIKGDGALSAVLYMMRRLACYVNIDPLRDDPGAIAETKLRLSILRETVDQLIEDANTA